MSGAVRIGNIESEITSSCVSKTEFDEAVHELNANLVAETTNRMSMDDRMLDNIQNVLGLCKGNIDLLEAHSSNLHKHASMLLSLACWNLFLTIALLLVIVGVW